MTTNDELDWDLEDRDARLATGELLDPNADDLAVVVVETDE